MTSGRSGASAPSGCQPAASAADASSQSGIPNAGDLRVFWIPQLGMDATFSVDVPDLQTASLLLDALAQYDLFQLKHHVKGDYANTGGLEVFENGEWLEWESNDGDDFDCVRDDPALFASAIETQRATTAGRGPEDESAVGVAETPQVQS